MRVEPADRDEEHLAVVAELFSAGDARSPWRPLSVGWRCPPATPANGGGDRRRAGSRMIPIEQRLELNAEFIVLLRRLTIWFASGRREQRRCRAAMRACCCALTPSPEKPKLPPVGSDSDRTLTPLPNVCEPENDIDIGVAFGALIRGRSRRKPARPNP